MLGGEILVVFAVSLGASAVYALVSFIGAVTGPRPLGAQTAVIDSALAPGRPTLDLALQLVGLASALAPVALVVHLLHRSGESLGTLGLDTSRPTRDLGWGAGLAALVGGTGLGLYLLAYHLGSNLTVVPSTLPAVWWRIPVLVASAAQNALLEEVLVAGYLLHRLRQLGWSDRPALVVSSVLRGSYHLYQGLGGFVGNIAMGVLFGRLYQRYGRVAPLVVAHALIDTVAFVGYVLLVGHVSWLPAPHRGRGAH